MFVLIATIVLHMMLLLLSLICSSGEIRSPLVSPSNYTVSLKHLLKGGSMLNNDLPTWRKGFGVMTGNWTHDHPLINRMCDPCGHAFVDFSPITSFEISMDCRPWYPDCFHFWNIERIVDFMIIHIRLSVIDR